MRFSISDGFNKVVTVEKDFEGLQQVICEHTWSPAIFKNGIRNNANFESTDMVALDVDGGITLNEALDKFKWYKHILATTRNHQKEKGGKTTDRFRVILFLDKNISDADTYRATIQHLLDEWTFADPACKDPARHFFACKEVVSANDEGFNCPVISYTKVEQSSSKVEQKGLLAFTTRQFLKEGAPAGQWNTTLYKAAKDFQQQNYTYEEAETELKKVTGHLDANDIKTLRSAYASEQKHAPRLPAPAPTPVDGAYGWLNMYMHENQVDVKYNDVVYIGAQQRDMKYLFNSMFLASRDVPRRQQYTKDELTTAMELWIANTKDRIIARNLESLAYTGKDNSIKELVQIVTGRDDAMTEKVIEHFIWQVKRKMRGLPTVWETMPILVGKGGSGKSFVTRKIVEPVRELATGATMQIFGDERQHFTFTKYFVVVLDELARAEFSDLGSIKNLITAQEVSYRILGTHVRHTGRNLATFIGSSNEDVSDVIRDTTGMRRFFQINCVDSMDHKQVEGFDYGRIWRSVDETGPAPILSIKAEIDSNQEALRAKSTVEEWLEFNCSLGKGKTRLKDAYKHYADFMRLQGRKSQFSYKQFSKKLKSLVETKEDKTSIYFILSLKDNEYNGIEL